MVHKAINYQRDVRVLDKVYRASYSFDMRGYCKVYVFSLIPSVEQLFSAINTSLANYFMWSIHIWLDALLHGMYGTVFFIWKSMKMSIILKCNLPFQMIGSLATYLIILIQFDLSNSQQGVTNGTRTSIASIIRDWDWEMAVTAST